MSDKMGSSYNFGGLLAGSTARTILVVFLGLGLLAVVIWSLYPRESHPASSIIPANYWSSTPQLISRPNIQSAPRESYSYTVLNVKEISMWTLDKDPQPQRKRFDISIMSPSAQTFESRGQVVVQACKSLRDEYDAHVVRVWLELNENTQGLGFVLAMATYSPDGKGMTGMESGEVWANASSTDYQPGAKALRMTKNSRLGDISMEQARIIGSRKPFTPH